MSQEAPQRGRVGVGMWAWVWEVYLLGTAAMNRPSCIRCS